MNTNRGTGLLDLLPADALSHAAARAYERLSEHEQDEIDALVEAVLQGIARRGRKASLGRGSILELLAAIGRIV